MIFNIDIIKKIYMPVKKQAFSSENRYDLLLKFRKIYHNVERNKVRNRLLNVVHHGTRMSSCRRGIREVDNFLRLCKN